MVPSGLRFRRGADATNAARREISLTDGCEVERKWKKGEYEEKVKCKPGRYGSRW
jgi:hypothetical protein